MVVRAYHFTEMSPRGGCILRDGTRLPPGKTERYAGEVVICKSGLHASEHPFDALRYAPGPMLRIVECDDIVTRQDDKLVCRVRREVARIDATRVLRLFAVRCAERALKREEAEGRVVDPRSWNAVRVAERYAAGAATDNELSAARAAAWEAAEAALAAALAAAEAAWEAAEAALAAARAALAAARKAAWEAAREAAAAALAAARAAWEARAAEVQWQRETFAAMVHEAFEALDIDDAKERSK